MCKLATHSLSTNNINYINVNPEVSNIDQWKSNNRQIIEENYELITQLNLDFVNIDSKFVNRMFLHYLTQSYGVVLKYFPFDSYDFTVDELIAVAKKHRITLIGLYRKNVLDTLISQIVKFNFGEVSAIDEAAVLSSVVRYDKSILDNDIITVYRLYSDIYQQINSAHLFETVIAYEDLSFNSVTDSAVFKQKLQVKPVKITDKSVSPNITAHVLSQLPFLKADLIARLKQANIPVTDDFCFLLGN